MNFGGIFAFEFYEFEGAICGSIKFGSENILFAIFDGCRDSILKVT